MFLAATNIPDFSNLWEFDYQTFKVILNIFLSLLILCIFVVIYYRKIKLRKANELPKNGLINLFERGIIALEGVVIKNIGKRYRFMTSYFLMIFFYLNVSNILSILLDLNSPFTYITVIFLLGSVTLLGIYYFGFAFQNWKFFKEILNPMKLLSNFTSFISLSFRLFGNLIAGFFIMALLYFEINNLAESIGSSLPYLNIFSILIAPLHIYFDLFSVPLHSFIFVMLTLTYWNLVRVEKSSKKKIIKRI